MIRLGEVLQTTTTIKWNRVDSDTKFRYIDLTSVNRASHSITGTAEIDAKNAPSRAQKVVHSDDVLFGTTRPTLNRLCIVDEVYDGQICSTGLCVLRADQEKVIPGFIYYLLTTPTFKTYIEGLQRGTSYPAVTDKDVKNYEFNLPSINEQRKIVQKLNVSFKTIDEAIRLAEINQIKTTSLMKSKIESEFDRLKSENMLVDQLIKEKLIGLVRSKKEQNSSEGYGYLKMDSIGNKNDFIKKPYSMVSVTNDEIERYSLQRNDFLFNTRNSKELVGKFCLYPGSNESVVFNNNILRLRFNDEIDPEYVYFAFLSDKVQSQLSAVISGTTNVAAIYYKELKNVEVPIPEYDTQILLVNRFSNMLKKVKSLQDRYAIMIVKLKELKHSLLNTAFSSEERTTV